MQQRSKAKKVWGWIFVLVFVVLGFSWYASSDGKKDMNDPRDLWAYVQDNYAHEDVTDKVFALFGYRDYAPGLFDSLGIDARTLLEYHDKHLIDSIWALYAMSKDSCNSRSVKKEIDGIRELERQLKLDDFESLGLTEDMLMTCMLSGELFPTRERLNEISRKARVQDFSSEIEGIRQLEARAPWDLAALGITEDSLMALEIVCRLAVPRGLMRSAEEAAGIARLDILDNNISGLHYTLTDLTEKYAGSHPLWDEGLEEVGSFLEGEERDSTLHRTAHTVAARVQIEIMRTRTPKWWWTEYRHTLYERRDRRTPIEAFLDHQKASALPLEEYLTRKEFSMWVRKWTKTDASDPYAGAE